MQARFTNKVAFVTGGGSGIGAATAHRLAQEGATVIICGRSQTPLDNVVESIRQQGGRAHTMQVDVSNEEAFVSALEQVDQQYGGLDILVNNAMAFSYGSIEEMSTQDWHSNFSTSVDGTFWGTRTAIKLMKAKGGAIVNLASICGELGTPMMAGYSAAKAAVINFSRAAAAEGAPNNIRVNVVIPAIVDTPATAGMLSDDETHKKTTRLIPMGRVGRSDELPSAIAFLASDDASYVTGACLPVDGGRAAVLITAMD